MSGGRTSPSSRTELEHALARIEERLVQRRGALGWRARRLASDLRERATSWPVLAGTAAAGFAIGRVTRKRPRSDHEESTGRRWRAAGSQFLRALTLLELAAAWMQAATGADGGT